MKGDTEMRNGFDEEDAAVHAKWEQFMGAPIVPETDDALDDVDWLNEELRKARIADDEKTEALLALGRRITWLLRAQESDAGIQQRQQELIDELHAQVVSASEAVDELAAEVERLRVAAGILQKVVAAHQAFEEGHGYLSDYSSSAEMVDLEIALTVAAGVETDREAQK